MPREIDLRGCSKQNSFWILAEDMESDEEVVPVCEEPVCEEPVCEPPVAAPVETKEEQFRTWVKDENRFTSELKRNIFSSPFSKKKNWMRPRFREEDESWISIRKTEEESGPVIYEQRDEFPSMLTRSTRNIFVEDTITPTTEMSAVAWAERIKKSLERAEASRVKKDEDRMSFFRTQ